MNERDLLQAALRRLVVGRNPAPPQVPARPTVPTLSGPHNIPAPPKVQITDPAGRLTGAFDGATFRNIINSAKMSRVDPLTALAIAAQESTFGRQAPDNPMQVNHALHPDRTIEVEDPHANTVQGLLNSMGVFKALTGRQRRHTPEDEELNIQAYNGLGRIQGGSEVAPGTPMYGGKTQLHGGRDRPYGKAVLRLREMIAQQPDVRKLLDE